ncbi:uncharacterized protein LOC144440120 isoform X2 [Glandiceps talaboti]
MAQTHLYHLPVISLLLCIVPCRCSYYYCPQLPSLHHDGNEAVIAQPYHYVYIPTGNAFYLNSSFPTGIQHGTLCVNQIIEGVDEVIKCTRYIPSLGQSNLDDNFRLSERNGYYMLFVKSLKPYQNKVKYIWWMYGTNDVVTHTTVENIDTDSKPWQITAENDVIISVYGRLFHTKATEITLMNATSNTPLTSAWLTDGDAYRCHLWKDELEGDIALAANNDYFLIVFNMSCVVSGRYVLITTLEKDESEKRDINVIVQGKQSANVVILEHPSNYGDSALIQCNVSWEIHREPRWTLNQRPLQINEERYLYTGPNKTLRFDSFYQEYQGSYSCIIEEDCHVIKSQPITLAVTSAVDSSLLISPHPMNNNTAGTHSGKGDRDVIVIIYLMPVFAVLGVLCILATIAIYRCLKHGDNIKLCRVDYQRQQQEEPQDGGNVDEEEEMNDEENVRFSHLKQEQPAVVYRKPRVATKPIVENYSSEMQSPYSDNGLKERVVEEASPIQDSDKQPKQKVIPKTNQLDPEEIAKLFSISDDLSADEGPRDDLAKSAVELAMKDGCGCKIECFTSLSVDRVWEYRLNVAVFQRDQLDVLILSKLEQSEVLGDTIRGGKRERQYFNYTFVGQPVCEKAWRYIHSIAYRRKKI